MLGWIWLQLILDQSPGVFHCRLSQCESSSPHVVVFFCCIWVGGLLCRTLGDKYAHRSISGVPAYALLHFTHPTGAVHSYCTPESSADNNFLIILSGILVLCLIRFLIWLSFIVGSKAKITWIWISRGSWILARCLILKRAFFQHQALCF